MKHRLRASKVCASWRIAKYLPDQSNQTQSITILIHGVTNKSTKAFCNCFCTWSIISCLSLHIRTELSTNIEKKIVRHTYLVRFPVEGGATVMLSFVLRVLADLVFLSTVLGDMSFLYWGMMHQTVILLLDVFKIKYSYCTCVYSNSLFI